MELATGLFILIRDLVVELRYLRRGVDQEMILLIEELKMSMLNLIDSIKHLKTENSHLSFGFMIEIMSKIMNDIPDFAKRHETAMETEDNYYVLMDKISDFLRERKMTVDYFIKQHLKLTNEHSTTRDIADKLRIVLKKNIDYETIFNGLNPLDAESGQGLVKLSKFHELITEFVTNNRVELNRYVTTNRQLGMVYHDINEELSAFIKSDVDFMCKQLGNYELIQLVKNVKHYIVDRALVKMDDKILLNFTKNLETAFYKKEHKVYLMEIFRQMILIEYNSEKETAEKETRIRAVQLVLSNAGMGKMAISMINKDNDISIVHGAVQLLEAMLIRSDPDLKESLLEYLKEGGQSYTLFSYIKNELRECRERIIYKYNRKNSIISKRHSTFKIKMDSEINDNSTWS